MAIALALSVVVLTDVSDGVEHGSYNWRQGSDGVCDGYVPNKAFTCEGAAQQVVLIDDHGEVMGEGDAAAGRDQGLGLYGFVAVAGKQPRWIEPVPAEDMFGQVGCASVVRPDPRIAGQVGWIDHWGFGKAVDGGQQNLDRVVEQSVNCQSVGDGFRGEVVVEHDGQVEFAAAKLCVGGRGVDEVVADHQIGVLFANQGGHLGGEIDKRAEERPESDGSGMRGGQSLQLHLGQRQPVQDRRCMVDEQLAGRGGLNASAAPDQQRGVKLPFE
jgi:hypothetical protein